MKIEIKSNIAAYQFKDMDAGEVFMFEGGFYLVTDEADDNAVRLEDGVLCHFTDDDYVQPVNNVKVVIE